MNKNTEINGCGFGTSYTVDDFSEIPNPKTVYIFERGSFVQCENSGYSERKTTIATEIENNGEIVNKKYFNEAT